MSSHQPRTGVYHDEPPCSHPYCGHCANTLPDIRKLEAERDRLRTEVAALRVERDTDRDNYDRGLESVRSDLNAFYVRAQEEIAAANQRIATLSQLLAEALPYVNTANLVTGARREAPLPKAADLAKRIRETLADTQPTTDSKAAPPDKEMT